MTHIYEVLADTHSAEYWYIQNLQLDVISSMCLEQLDGYIKDLGVNTINDILRISVTDELSKKALKKFEDYRLEYGI